MTTAIQEAHPRTSALVLMGQRLNCDPTKLNQTLKSTVFKGASDEELLALVVVANEYGLNPLTKELYAFPAKGGGIVPVVSVDGWISMSNDHPQMDGIEFEDHHDDAGKLVSITCTIWRKDRNRPIKVTEYLEECARNTEPWKMKHRMLRHKALIQCARVAFGFSGIYDDDEAADIARNGGMRDASGRVVEETENRPSRASRATPPPTLEEELNEALREDEPIAAETAEEFIPAQVIEDLQGLVHEAEITMATFEAKCRKAKLLTATETISIALKSERLKKIAAAASAVIEGTYKEGDAQ